MLWPYVVGVLGEEYMKGVSWAVCTTGNARERRRALRSSGVAARGTWPEDHVYLTTRHCTVEVAAYAGRRWAKDDQRAARGLTFLPSVRYLFARRRYRIMTGFGID